MKATQREYSQYETRMKNKSRKRPVGRPPFLTERDCRILNYLWRWKVASTASVHEMINRPSSEYSTYKILFKLEGAGFVISQFDYAGNFSVWTLSKQGFLIVKSKLPELSDDSFSSDHFEHDRLAQAFHLGEWATHQFPIVEFFTRQEIQRIDVMDYPDWVSKSKEHQPDGYTRVTGSKMTRVFSFEVELFARRESKYETMLQFYKYARSLARVYWLIDSPETKEQILKAKATVNDESFNYHVFVDLSDFLKNGWDAVIVNERSEKVHTIRENMQEVCGDIYSELMGNAQGKSTANVHLNHLKVIGKSKP
ncbi:MAG: hypothetical protein H7328_10335 [Bdellovibrio sp.]|nr:hypothetical protein [Bdellovibrio sp.]